MPSLLTTSWRDGGGWGGDVGADEHQFKLQATNTYLVQVDKAQGLVVWVEGAKLEEVDAGGQLVLNVEAESAAWERGQHHAVRAAI